MSLRHHPALLLLLAACSGTPTAPTPSTSPLDAEPPPVAPIPRATGPSLVLVTMDTTRVDHIGAYGYEKAHTPSIDGVAAQGARFERAYSTIPLTTPAHASIMSGLYPTRHGIHSNGDAILSDDVETLAERLQGRGYHTAASVSAFVTTRIWNLDQGFDSYFDAVSADANARDRRWSRERPAGEVVDDLEKWLTQKPTGESFFVWAHFYDPHAPYLPPDPWDKQLDGRPYDGEIAYMDAQIGRLKALAEAAAGEAGVAIILVADHGEAFGEHGEHTHGNWLYEPTMRIPFIIRPPAALPESRVIGDVTVSNVDVMPTALGLLQQEVPPGLDGRDLSGVLTGAAIADRGPVYMEAESVWSRFGFHPEWAAAAEGWKLFATPAPRLFNVDTDPEEKTNRHSEAEQAERVLTLGAFVDTIQAARKDIDNFNASPEIIDQLAALGYISGEEDNRTELSSALDAKDQAPLIARIERAQALSRSPKTMKEAETAMREVLTEHPTMGEMRMGLAGIFRRQGRLKEAEALLEEGIAQQPNSTLLRANLAEVLAAQNRFEEAYNLVKTVYEQVPNDDLSRYAMLRYLKELKRNSEALALGNRWLGLDPSNLGLKALVGELEVLYGDRPRGEQLLIDSLADSVPRNNVHRTLAQLAFARQDIAGAATRMEGEVTWFPFRPDLRLELGNLYMKLERWDDAAAEYAILTEMRPRSPDPRRLWSQAIFSSGDHQAAADILAPALAEFPDDPWVLLLQANILESLGRSEEGRKVFAEAKALHSARRDAMEQELGFPLLEDPTSADEQGLPGLQE